MHILKNLTNFVFPGIVVRVSHLLVVQVIFIFSALAMILLWPQESIEERTGGQNPKSSEIEFTRVAAKLAAAKDTGLLTLDSLVKTDPWFRANVESFAILHEDWNKLGRRFVDSSFLTNPNSAIVQSLFGGTAGKSIAENHENMATLFYYRFDDSSRKATVLVGILKEGSELSSKSNLFNTLLNLFLVSILISLLGVYLVLRRFKQPFDRLVRGMEKTAEGELHYLVENPGDSELNKIATAFNQMSSTLWSNHNKFKDLNLKLSRTNAALWQSQLLLSTVFDTSPDCIVVTNDDGEIILVNRTAKEMFGYSHKEMIGLPINNLFQKSSNAGDAVSIFRGDGEGVEHIALRQNGEKFPAYVINTDMEISIGKTSLFIIGDISESQSFQEMLIRLDRYSTQGEMAVEIAHEINNYLAVLSGNLELLPKIISRGDTEKTETKLELMRVTVGKIARFSDGLLDRPHEDPRFEPTRVNQLVENVLAFLKPQHKFASINMETSLAEDIPYAEMDISLIQQLLVNLIYNSADALSETEGDKLIRVVTSSISKGDEKIIVIEVRDNGPGVPQMNIDSMFDKRFTTKRHGHGIGLITCQRLVQSHNGFIRYSFDNGALFTVELPVKHIAAIDKDVNESVVHS